MENTQKDEEIEYMNAISERYRPFLIHASTYCCLTDHILSLMPSQRNVLLSMNEYELHKINPAHPTSSDSPTHLILFCIRFIADDMFQPIGGLLIYEQIDQSAILAECVKAYINDLWKLNLYVVGTVSPPSKLFKDIVGHLISNKEPNSYNDAISYSVEPIKEIVHIYDIQFLIIRLQKLLQEFDIVFKVQNRGNKIFTACWKDIEFVMNAAPEFKMIAEFINQPKETVQRRVHIFTEQIYSKYLEVRDQGLLSKHDGGCVELMNSVRSFLRFFEYDFIYPPDYPTLNWTDLIYILNTMTFQKTEQNLNDLRSLNLTAPDNFSENAQKKDKKKIAKNVSEIKKNCQTSQTHEFFYKDFLAANNGLSSIYELCEVLRKTKTFEENTKNGADSKTENSDLEVSLRKLSCDNNVVNRGAEEVLEKKVGASGNHRDDKIIYIKCKDKSKLFPQDRGNKEKTESEKKEPPDCRVTLTQNTITREIICTIQGIKQLMSLMARRRVKQIKPDALIVEHIDFLVTKIQTSINQMDHVYYYGHAYTYMDSALAFATLTNTKGLYLISKD